MSTSLPTIVYTPKLPITTLSEFTEEVSGLLENIVGPWSQILLKEDVRQPATDALNNLKSIQARVGQVFPAGLDPTQLSEVGLAPGPQQFIKFKGLNDEWEGFNNEGTVTRLERVLGWIIHILGSIALVYREVEAVKEFVETIAKLIVK